MTLPTAVPAQYNGTDQDFLKVKADRSGALRLSALSTPIAATTAVNTIVGLVPFRRGARLALQASEITFDALGTGVTASVGVIYNDNVNNVNNTTLFATGVATPANGGTVALAYTTAAEQWFATGDGWVTVTITGAATTTLGNVHGQYVLTYDPPMY